MTKTRVTMAGLLLATGCNIFNVSDTPWCDPSSPLYAHLTREEQAMCEQADETGAEDGPHQAWCFLDVDDEPIRDWCYPAEHGQPDPSLGDYGLTDCAAVFDFDAWNYDGTCDNGVCAEAPETARLCFDADQAGGIAGKAPGDLGARLCWKDPYATVPESLYLSIEYLDDEMLNPLCEAQAIPTVGPACGFDQGVLCQVHNMFCTCKCSDDSDCEAPSVCEGYYPGQLAPSFCVYPEP